MARPRRTEPAPAPSAWNADDLIAATQGAGDADRPDDPMAAWDHFWRAAGRKVPEHVNRTARIRSAIRRVGLQ